MSGSDKSENKLNNPKSIVAVLCTGIKGTVTADMIADAQAPPTPPASSSWARHDYHANLKRYLDKALGKSTIPEVTSFIKHAQSLLGNPRDQFNALQERNAVCQYADGWEPQSALTENSDASASPLSPSSPAGVN